MLSRRVVTAVVLAGAVFATPVLAQEGRGRSRGPGPRAQEGGSRAPSRAVPRAPSGGSMAGRGDRRAPSPRVRQSAPPPVASAPPRAESDRRGPSGATGRYAVPRDQAYANRGGPGVRPGPPVYRAPAPRGYVGPRYDGRYDRRYDGRGYAGRGYVGPGYVRPGYDVPRYSYGARPNFVPRYIAPGFRGAWGPSRWAGPRIIVPRIITYGAWQPYFYRPSIGLGMHYGYDGLYPFGAVPPVFYNPSPGAVLGGLRITDAPRDAQVFADGYYVGIVDDFDGFFQHLNLEPGPHRIEIHSPGYQPVAFDVVIQPGQTVTLRADY